MKDKRLYFCKRYNKVIFTNSQIPKLLVITLALCCLTTSVCGGKLSKAQALANSTEVAATAKEEISKTEAAAALKEIEIKSSEEGYDEEEEEEEEENNDTADNENEPAKTNAVQPADDTSLSIWSIANRLWNWISEDISENLFANDDKTSAVGERRTFGKIRRLQMALIPIVFKFGVLSAMIAFLVGIGVKTLFLVKVLVFMNLLALLAKLFTLKTHFGHFEHFSAPPAPAWSPYVSSGWHSAPEPLHSNKEIHLHIHGGHLQEPQNYLYGNVAASKSQTWERRNDPYYSDQLTTSMNLVAHNSSFPGNYRMF